MTRWALVMMPLRRSISNPNLNRLTVMKKIYIALAVVAAALLSSCEKEKDFKQLTPIGENGIAFTLKNAATRSMDAVYEAPVQKGITIPIGVDANGDAIFLEETIENLNPSPATKGAPAYTVNVGKLYETMGVYAAGDFGDATFTKMDEEMVGGGWRYQHNYPGVAWPSDENEKVDFYLRMPAIDSEFDYSTAKSVAFDYTSTASGAAQQDILFGHTYISHKEHNEFLPNGAPVEMVHALTGVKFRTASENGNQTKTIITKAEFTGLKGAGHCVITYGTDNSASVVWSNLGAGPEKFSLEFTNPEYSSDAWADGTIGNEGGTQWNSDLNGTSWTAAAADHNLNNADGELTFWFIPQEITDDVKLKITFCVKTPDTSGAAGGGYVEHDIDFGELLNKDRSTPVTWEAGQLRTYTLNPKLVDVEIFDTMAGYKKSNLHVTNTGNVSELVRILVIGNWYGWASQDDADAGKEPMILVGYKTDGSGGATDNEMVDPWFREDDKWGSYFDNSFKGGHPASGSKWVRGTGSYFYYMDAIGPNSKLSGTDALFQDYTLPASEVPKIYIPNSSSNIRSEAVGVHLVMEVVIQAIAAPSVQADGTPYPEGEVMPAADIWKAWTDAIGKEIKEKPYNTTTTTTTD